MPLLFCANSSKFATFLSWYCISTSFLSFFVSIALNLLHLCIDIVFFTSFLAFCVLVWLFCLWAFPPIISNWTINWCASVFSTLHQMFQLYWSSCLLFTFIGCGIMQMNHDIWWSNNRDYHVISGPATSDLQLETMWIHLPLYEIQIKVVIRGGILSIMGITCRHAEKRFQSYVLSLLFSV